MKTASIIDLLEFLEYIAKTVLSPASELPYYNVTFTISEIRAALRDMNEGCELYSQFRQETATEETGKGNFCHQEPNHKLVYICAPLRGDVERNIEFARQRAQEVFRAGEVPICPHLLFPPIADPCNESEDQAAREMGLWLVALCQQVNVYGNSCTAGMQGEIDLAQQLNIPVKLMEGGVRNEEK